MTVARRQIMSSFRPWGSGADQQRGSGVEAVRSPGCNEPRSRDDSMRGPL